MLSLMLMRVAGAGVGSSAPVSSPMSSASSRKASSHDLNDASESKDVCGDAEVCRRRTCLPPELGADIGGAGFVGIGYESWWAGTEEPQPMCARICEVCDEKR